MELSRLRLWVFYFLVTCKKLLLTNKNIQDNFSLKSKKFPRASVRYPVCDQINSPKADYKLLNKRKPVQSYRENTPKKQVPLDDIHELSFKVKFPFPNTPSPKVGGLRERSFTILMGKALQRKGLLKFWLMESPKLKAKYPQILNFVSRCFLLCKPRLSVLKERRKIADRPVLSCFKASSKALKGEKRYADKTTTRVLSRGFLHNPQPFENTQLFPHLLRDHPLSSYSMRWSRIGVVCVLEWGWWLWCEEVWVRGERKGEGRGYR